MKIKYFKIVGHSTKCLYKEKRIEIKERWAINQKKTQVNKIIKNITEIN